MKAKKQIPYIWLGPIIVLGIMLILYATGGIYPFGSASTAFSDGFSQFVPFLSELKTKIVEGGSLLFSWHIGGGTNFWATIGYYLASPFSLIALLFPVEKMYEAFALITLIKPFFIALTFGIFLKNTYKKNDLSIVIFSVLWAMSGFILGGIYVTSWLDAIIYFPLVIMGLQKMMDGESAWMYALFLGLTIASNFYIGWITCIFCVLYFIYCFIADDEVSYEGVTGSAETENTENDESAVDIFALFRNSYLLKSFLKFGFSSLLAGGISAIMTLPMAYALQSTTKGTLEHQHDFTKSPSEIMGLLASLVFPFKNMYSTMASKECIFAFAGIVTLILAVAYFFAKGISIRKKVANGLLIAIMWVSMFVYSIYVVWHGFGEPAGLMYRFAFIYSFIMLKMAFEALCEIKTIKWYGFVVGAVFALFCASGIYFNVMFRTLFFSPGLIIAIAVAVIVFTVLLILLAKKENRKTLITAIMLICVIAESLLFNYNSINTLELEDNLSEKQIVDEMTENVNEYDRIHFTSQKQDYKDTVMYNAIFGYNGFVGYSSLADRNFTLSITDMGTYGNRMNLQNGASEQTPVFNLFFPTNYYIDGADRLSDSEFRTKISEKDGYKLYRNNFTMPFIYTVDAGISEWDPTDYFIVLDNINESTKLLTGTEEDVAVYNNPSNFKYENCTHISAYDRANANGVEMPKEYYEFIEQRMAGFSYKVTDMTKPVNITFDSIAEADGMMYVYIDTYELTDMTVTLNGKTKEYYLFGADDNRIFELGEVKKGDVATITIGGYREMESDSEQVYFYENNSFTSTVFTVDMAKFKAAYDKLDSMSDTEILEFSDTHIRANVKSNTDGLLYIPTSYDDGWKIYIDGVETPLFEQQSHILMAPITQGEHTVEMKYCPVGFVPGIIISGASLGLLIAWAVISTKRSKKLNSINVNEE